MTYLEFLAWLRNTGDNLPEIMADVQVILERAQNIRRLLSVPELFTANGPTEAEAALEQDIVARAMGGNETFAGPFQRILDFIRNNQELIAILISLFGAKKA